MYVQKSKEGQFISNLYCLSALCLILIQQFSCIPSKELNKTWELVATYSIVLRTFCKNIFFICNWNGLKYHSASVISLNSILMAGVSWKTSLTERPRNLYSYTYYSLDTHPLNNSQWAYDHFIVFDLSNYCWACILISTMCM